MAEPAKESKKLSVTSVAVKLKLNYHRARNMILKGELGETFYEGRHLMVTEAGLAAFLEERKKAAAKKKGGK